MPGWQARVVPNLYPAFDRQEVVVHTPRHARTVADLDDGELAAVSRAWHARFHAAIDDGYYPLVFVNEGKGAGASLPHSHSQLVWLREAPPQARDEEPNLQEGRCALCAVLGDSLEIAVEGDLSLRAAGAGRAPYETLIAPRAHEARPGRENLEAALRLLRHMIRRLHRAEAAVPFNAWLHHGQHWHLEIVPRLSVLAGLELGAGLYVNWLPPEEAVERLSAG